MRNAQNTKKTSQSFRCNPPNILKLWPSGSSVVGTKPKSQSSTTCQKRVKSILCTTVLRSTVSELLETCTSSSSKKKTTLSNAFSSADTTNHQNTQLKTLPSRSQESSKSISSWNYSQNSRSVPNSKSVSVLISSFLMIVLSFRWNFALISSSHVKMNRNWLKIWRRCICCRLCIETSNLKI